MTHSDDSLETLMAAMAAGDFAALWTFHELFASKLRAVVLADVRSMCRHDVACDSGRIDSLTADAATVIFERAAGWKPGGAKPWNWAALAIRSMIAAELGHRSVELSDDENGAEAVGTSTVSDADLTLEHFVSLTAEFEPFMEAWRAVGSERNQEVAWLFRVQKETGDPSPAHTVADEFGISPANARKIHQRHFEKVSEVVASEERFESLRHWEWFAA